MEDAEGKKNRLRLTRMPSRVFLRLRSLSAWRIPHCAKLARNLSFWRKRLWTLTKDSLAESHSQEIETISFIIYTKSNSRCFLSDELLDDCAMFVEVEAKRNASILAEQAENRLRWNK
ncbi:hypothetical protein AVEN_61256-1 [Araneus ventricosus]|uniref:Uncharacterized protein n=1 Tax=Araneus ventricosus TaxID=182803 RepID=A0A4Y2EDG7_ARAVE|nr:hypothetical protein AVEN_61256-1 [Araneus ventricosus]